MALLEKPVSERNDLGPLRDNGRVHEAERELHPRSHPDPQLGGPRASAGPPVRSQFRSGAKLLSFPPPRSCPSTRQLRDSPAGRLAENRPSPDAQVAGLPDWVVFTTVTSGGRRRSNWAPATRNARQRAGRILITDTSRTPEARHDSESPPLPSPLEGRRECPLMAENRRS